MPLYTTFGDPPVDANDHTGRGHKFQYLQKVPPFFPQGSSPLLLLCAWPERTLTVTGMNSQSTSEIRFYKYLKYNARYCKCGRKCIIRVSDTPANPKRLFYTCPRKLVNDTNEETRNSNMKSCNFFEWAVPINTLDEATSTRTM